MTPAIKPSRGSRRTTRLGLVLTSLFALGLVVSAYSNPALAQQPPEAAPALVPPTLVESVEPAYPESKRASGEAASVILSLELDVEGHVTKASVLESGGAEFDESALAAAKGLVFSPATKDKVPVASRIAFRFDFSLAEPTADAAAASAPQAAPTGSGPDAKPSAQGASSSPPSPATKPSPTPAAAEQAPLDTIDIDVEGERPPREPTTRILAAEEIAKMPGTNGDALRAVTSLPGVARPPGLSGELAIRGSAPRDTQVFFDGIPVPLAYHFGGLSSVVPSEALESIQMIPSNFGPQYGRAHGGIIDAKLRAPRSDRWGGLLQLDLLDARILAEGPAGKSTRVMVGARRSWVDAWLGPMLRASGAGVTAAPVYYDYQAMVEHDLTPDTTLRLALLGSDDRMELTMKTPTDSDPATGGEMSMNMGFARLHASATSHLNQDITWENTLALGTVREDFVSGPISLDLTSRSVNARSDFRMRLTEGVAATVGLDVEWADYDITLIAPAMDYETGESSGPVFGRPSTRLATTGQLTRPAAYTLFELQPTRQLTLLPGVRVDYATETQKTTTDPRLGARYELQPGAYRTTLKAGVGLFHEPPAPYESIEPLGNGSVHPSRAVHYSLGIEQRVAEALEISVEGFYKDLQRLVVAVPDAQGSPSGLFYRNRGRGRAYGTETMIRYDAKGRFFGWLAYTLSRSERSDDPSLPLERFSFDQTHILTALGSYRLGAGWQLGARFRYVTGSPYTPTRGGMMDYDAGAYAPVQSRKEYSARLPAFHQLDVRIDKTWQFDAWKLQAYLDVQNVYNRQNVEAMSNNYDYSRTSTVSGLPFLPIIGVRGEI